MLYGLPNDPFLPSSPIGEIGIRYSTSTPRADIRSDFGQHPARPVLTDEALVDDCPAAGGRGVLGHGGSLAWVYVPVPRVPLRVDR